MMVCVWMCCCPLASMIVLFAIRGVCVMWFCRVCVRAMWFCRVCVCARCGSVACVCARARQDGVLGWPEYKRAWEDLPWSTPVAMAPTLPTSPAILPDSERLPLPDPATMVIPPVAIYITSVVLHPVPKNFSRPGSGGCCCRVLFEGY